MMNLKKISLLWICLVLVLFNSCQKEKYNSNVKLLIDAPVSTSSTTWTISGSILSSGKIDFTDHGFQVTVGSNSKLIPLGATVKGGKVQATVDGNPGDLISNVTLYAIDDRGNTFTSESIGDPVAVTAPNHYDDGVGERFNAIGLISDVSKYAITEYGIEYRALGSSVPWLTYPAMVNYYTTPTVPIDIQISHVQGLFVPSEIYEYRVYVKYYDLVKNTPGNMGYSVISQFTASSK